VSSSTDRATDPDPPRHEGALCFADGGAFPCECDCPGCLAGYHVHASRGEDWRLPVALLPTAPVDPYYVPPGRPE
jgi:hypothetical protein